MTHACCPSCRVRFSPTPAAPSAACPTCGTPLHPLASHEAMGFPLAEPPTSDHEYLIALAAALPRPLPLDLP